MSALAHEAPCDPGLDEVLWQAWKAMDLPEGYRAEIIEGSIEVSPTGRRRHTVLVHRLRRLLESRLTGSGLEVYQDGNVIHGRKVCIPDLFVGPEDLDEIPDEEGLGVDATRVPLVAEIVSPGKEAHRRDHVRKRRRYALAGIEVYVVIDDFEDEGTVTVFSSPDPEKGVYATKTTVAYGTPTAIPDGPAKGLELTADLTRP
ncbi:Uma2 family endonuclease [Streptomyces sp. NPDC101206]|uniref:Uma2 family endonuclease n=1 Tax=Streptomyces sp. NPDC101206 TaxID=3366128 RepID=UPI0037FF33B0